MAIYALIKNNTVENVIVADTQEHCPAGYDSYIQDAGLSVGDYLDDGVWKRPTYKRTRLTFGEYIDEGGLVLFAAIIEAASTNPMVAAVFERLKAAGDNIDLTNPLHDQGWDYLISIGVATQEDKTRVLN